VSGSVVSPELRARVRGLAQPIARALGRLGFSPNQLTLIGFGIAILAGIAAARQARATRLMTKTAVMNQVWTARPASSKTSSRTTIPAASAAMRTGGAANPSARRWAPRYA